MCCGDSRGVGSWGISKEQHCARDLKGGNLEIDC
jgi:hypothetical protein